MGVLVQKVPWTTQPPAGVPVAKAVSNEDWEVLVNFANGPVNMIDGTVCDRNDSPKIAPYDNGIGQTNSNTNDLYISNIKPIGNNEPMTIVIAFTLLGASSGGKGFVQVASDVSSAFPYFQLQDNSGDFRVLYEGIYCFTEAGAFSTHRRHAICMTFAGTTLTACRNGKVAGVYGAVTGGSPPKSKIWWGNGYGSSREAVIHMGAFKPSSVSVARALELSANPWQLFEP